MSGFGKQVKDWTKKQNLKLDAIIKETVQDTIEIAQYPMRAGGNMRIKTGFLRASIQASVGSIPKGPVGNPQGKEYPVGSQAAGAPLQAVLIMWRPLRSERLMVGWTANYARPREYKDGFLRHAVARWQTTANTAVKRVEQRFG